MPIKVIGTEFYNVSELSKILGLHKITLQRYCRTGRLKSQRVGRRYLVSAESLKEFLSGNENRMQSYLKRREGLFRV